MKETNWFNKLTRTNETYGEYYNILGWKYDLVLCIDEDVDSLTYYYPYSDRYFITVVGNSNDIEALTKDMRFVEMIRYIETNNLNYTFDKAIQQCTIDEDGVEIPEYEESEPYGC
jgi:hypothetical protein